MYRGDGAVAVVGLTTILVYLAFWIAIIWTAVHFVCKFW
jgi:hypothetical protein